MTEKLRSLDLLCFSSQYFFVVSVGCFGNMLLLLSVQILVRIMHNPFGDKLTIPLMSTTLAILFVSLKKFQPEKFLPANVLTNY